MKNWEKQANNDIESKIHVSEQLNDILAKEDHPTLLNNERFLKGECSSLLEKSKGDNKKGDNKQRKKQRATSFRIKKKKKPLNLVHLKSLCRIRENESKYNGEAITSDDTTISRKESPKRKWIVGNEFVDGIVNGCDIDININDFAKRDDLSDVENPWKREEAIWKCPPTYRIIDSDNTFLETEADDVKKEEIQATYKTHKDILYVGTHKKKNAKRNKKKKRRELRVDEAEEEEEEEEEEEVPRWKSKIDYIKSILCYSLKLGVIWRFPYVCYANGGGAFLFAYIICLFLLGFPMLLLEMTIGQKYQKSFIYCFKELCEKLIGVVISSILITTLCIIYFYTISTWTLLYFFKSFHFLLNWENEGINASDASKRFFLNAILNKSRSLTDFDYNRTNFQLLLCAALIFFILVFCLISRKRKKNGELVMVEMLQSFSIMGLFRYKELCICFILLLLLGRSWFLDGSREGMAFYLTIDFSKLKNGTIWVSAGSQILYSLGLAWGEMINYGSRNNKKNNFVKDGLIIMFSNMLISFVAGFIVFSVLGFMSKVSNMSISEVGYFSIGFPFVAYSIGITEISKISFFSIFFFGMFFILCIESLVVMIDMVIKTIMDLLNIEEGGNQKKNRRKKKRIISYVCFFLFCFNMFLTFPFGSYIVEIMDFITGIATIYVLAFCEIFALLKYYGIDNFINDIYFMTSIKLPYFVTYMYLWIIPFVLIVFFLVSICLLVFPYENESLKYTKSIGEREKGEITCSSNADCNGNGICEDKECICDVGWQGKRCEDPYFTVEVLDPLSPSPFSSVASLVEKEEVSKNQSKKTEESSILPSTELQKPRKDEMSESNMTVEKNSNENNVVSESDNHSDNHSGSHVESESGGENKSGSENKSGDESKNGGENKSGGESKNGGENKSGGEKEKEIKEDLFSKHDVKLIKQTNFDFNVFNNDHTNYSLIPVNEWKLVLAKYYQENGRQFVFRNARMEEEIQNEIREETNKKEIDVKKEDTDVEKENVSFLHEKEVEISAQAGEEALSKNKENEKQMLKGGQMEAKKEMVKKKEINTEENITQMYMNSFYYKSFTYDNFLVTPLLACPNSCNEDAGKGKCVNSIFRENGFNKNNLKHIENVDMLGDVSISHYDKIQFYENTKISQIGNTEIHDFSGKCLCDAEFIGKACSENKYIIGHSSLSVFIGWCFVFITLLPIPIIFLFPKVRNMFMRFLYINATTSPKKKMRNPYVPVDEKKKRKHKIGKCHITREFGWNEIKKKDKRKYISFNERDVPNESVKKRGSAKVRKEMSEFKKKKKRQRRTSDESALPFLKNCGFPFIYKRKVRKKVFNKSGIIRWHSNKADLQIAELKKKHHDTFENTLDDNAFENILDENNLGNTENGKQSVVTTFFNRNKKLGKKQKNLYSQLREMNVEFTDKEDIEDNSVCEQRNSFGIA